MISKNYDGQGTEEKWAALWQQMGIYQFMGGNSKPIYSIDTPPPYVSSAHLHIGHAMSYIQAEIITRFRRMQGYNIFYPMGFDDNGLPTERYVEKKHKINKAKITREEFIDLCLQETKAGAENYRRIWQRLGIGVDWSLTYNTIGKEAQRIAQKSFIDLFKKDLVYRADSPVFWCTTCGTALAQADLEDEEAEGQMYYITFQTNLKERLIIATTRPEMLPACVALYAHPEDARYQHIIGSKVRIPLFDTEVEIKMHSDVDPKTGTGLMMVCTWGDAEDVKKWKEDKLPTRTLVNKHGRFTDLAGTFQGKTLSQGRLAIIQALTEQDLIAKVENISHIKKVHERCGTAVEFYSSLQWFIKILDHKDEFLRLGDEFNWHPSFMKERYRDWVKGLKWDWCISRDRYYGESFPIWYCSNCDAIMLPAEQQLPIDPRNTLLCSHCPKCNGNTFTPEQQIMDTWMTSSLTPLINSHWGGSDDITNQIYPMNLRVQGFEIIRTWLFYTIVKSYLHTQSLPWDTVMISGWGLDSKGKKMSKSKDNFVEIDAVINQYSADAIRWWSTGARLGQNLRYNERDVKEGRKVVIKLWNVARFVETVLEKFPQNSQSFLPTTFADQWILAELQALIDECTTALEACDYSKARIALEKFFWIKYCDNYLELCKDRTWHPEKYDHNHIASLTATLRLSLETLLKLFAPILPYVTEEIYQTLFAENKVKSIHITDWPKVNDQLSNRELVDRSSIFIELISKIRHFKVNVANSYRAEIDLVSLINADIVLREAISDFAGLANAKRFFLDTQFAGGVEYKIDNVKIILGLSPND